MLRGFLLTVRAFLAWHPRLRHSLALLLVSLQLITALGATREVLRSTASPSEPWRWNKLEAFSGYWVRDVKAAPDGRLFAAAWEGLWEYDGYSMQFHGLPPDLPGTPMESSNGLLALRIAPDGAVYVLTNSNLWRWQGKGWTNLMQITASGEANTHSFDLGQDGTVWVAGKRCVYRVRGDQVTRIELPEGDYNSCALDRKGHLWLADSATGRVFRHQLDPQTQSPIGIPWVTETKTRAATRRIDLVAAESGTVWILTLGSQTESLRRVIGDRVETILGDFTQVGHSGQTLSMVAMPDDSFWLVSVGSMAGFDGDRWQVLGRELKHLPTGYPFASLVAPGRFVIGGRMDDLYQVDLSDEHWETWKDLHFAGEDKAGDSWFLSASQGILRRRAADRDVFTRFDQADGVIDQPNHLLMASDGTVWASGSNRGVAAIARWYDGRWERQLHPDLGPIISHLGAVELPDGKIIFTAGDPSPLVPGGMVSYQAGETRLESRPFGRSFAPRRVSSIAATAEGSYWLGGLGLVQKSTGTEAAPLRLPEFRGTWVDQVATDEQGRLWVAHWGGGAYSYDGKAWRHFRVTDGLASAGVMTVMIGRYSPGVWLGTNEGLTHFDGQSWQSHALSKTLRFDREGATLRESSDGSLWLNFAYRSWFFNSPTLLSERDRPIHTLRHRPDRRPPQTLYLDTVGTGQEGSPLFFRWTGHDAFSQTEQKDLQYSWRLDDRAWSPFTARTELLMSALAVGRHELAVRARDTLGNIDPTPVLAAFTVQPLYWKRPWFIGTLIAAVALLVWLTVTLVRTRIRHLVAMEELQLQFFTNVSHELRNPLAVVLGPLQSLLERCADPTLTGPLQMIYRNARKLEGLVDQLLEFRSSQLGRLTLHLAHGDIVAGLRESIEDYALLWVRKDQTVEVDLPATAWPCRFDQQKLQHLVGNLLSNAIKYTPAGGRIRVSATLTPPAKHDAAATLALTVTDNGPGISAVKRHMIFKPFFRAVNPDADEGGFGIGLAYVAEIIRLWNGRIRVQSPPAGQAHGTSFLVTLPLLAERTAPAPGSPAQVTTPPSDPGSGTEELPRSRPLVLIVEDDPDVRHFLTEELGRDYDVQAAPDGQRGLEIACAQAPDLVVLDLAMPLMDGLELCRRLKTQADTSHIPLLMLTARRSDDSRLQGAEAGADAYLTKPVDLRMLRVQVAGLLESRRLLREKFTRQVIIQPQEITVTPVDEVFLTKVLAVIEKHLGDPSFAVDDFARHMGMSRVTLYRKLSAVTGQAPFHFIRLMRLKRAAQLLGTGQLNVSDVIARVGLLDASYFSRIFREEFGMTPTEYRNRTRS